VLKFSLKYRLFFIAIILFIDSFSQEDNYSYGYEETLHFGSILPHRELVNEIIEGHSWIYEFSLFKNTKGKKNWQLEYNHPRIGVSGMILRLGNEKELGDSYGVYSFVEFPLNQRKIQWNLKFGYGLGFIEKPFNRETNFKNVAIGSRLNALIVFNSRWSINLSERLKASFGLSLVHFSNGSFTRPNLGINVVSVNTGLAYNFGKGDELITGAPELREKKWNKVVLTNFGLKAIPRVEGRRYPISTMSFNMLKSFTNKSSYGFGADLFYNSSLVDVIESETGEKGSTSDNFRIGLSGIYSMDIGKVSYLFQMGAYLKNQNKEEGFVYHRFTTRYYLNDKVFINLGLKTHYFVADFFELGVGYKLK
jgi:Lipid A 3-O-deacylase (PagL)